MKSRFYLIGTFFSAVLACHAGDVPKEKPLYPPTTIGTFTTSEVELLRAKIATMRYPLPADTIAALLPPSLIPDTWTIYDWPGEDSLGRNGGRILDYWLNQDYVLRVGQAYYSPPHPGSKDEWAVIIRSSERKTYNRTPYPFPKGPNQASEPTAASGGG
jgi:hypothetical protein